MAWTLAVVAAERCAEKAAVLSVPVAQVCPEPTWWVNPMNLFGLFLLGLLGLAVLAERMGWIERIEKRGDK